MAKENSKALFRNCDETLREGNITHHHQLNICILQKLFLSYSCSDLVWDRVNFPHSSSYGAMFCIK